MEKEYRYPDPGDALTGALIVSESKGDYWGKSEDNVLKYAREALGGSPCRMLDLGCGMGRLLPVFSPLATFLEGVEPDAARYEAAKKYEKKLTNVRVIRGDCHDVEGPYGAVICSHVLQHIPRATTEEIFRCLAALLLPGGKVVLTTTHAPGEEDLFVKEEFVNRKRCCFEITPEQFDAPPEGCLPVRFFAEKTVEELAKKYKLSIEMRAGYHFSDGEQTVEADRRKNGENKREKARDIFYLLRKED